MLQEYKWALRHLWATVFFEIPPGLELLKGYIVWIISETPLQIGGTPVYHVGTVYVVHGHSHFHHHILDLFRRHSVDAEAF